MGYERSASIALVSTFLVILLVGAQDTHFKPAPDVVPAPCPGSKCQKNICASKGLRCCQCEATYVTILGGTQETCACCPSGYRCCGAAMAFYCCPVSSPCKPIGAGCISLPFSEQFCPGKLTAEINPEQPSAT